MTGVERGDALARQIEAEQYDLEALQREQEQAPLPPTASETIRLARVRREALDQRENLHENGDGV